MTRPSAANRQVRYIHVRVYALRGISLSAGVPPISILPAAPERIVARLTYDDDALLAEIDRRTAVANMILDSMFRGASGEFGERLEQALSDAREHRRNQHGAGPYLVVEWHGQADEPFSEQRVETPSFTVVIHDGCPKPAGIPDSQARSLLAAIALLAPKLLAVKQANEGFVYYQASGKPLYCYSLKASGTAFTSLPVGTDTFSAAETWFDRFMADDFERVVRLLVASYEAEGDMLRAFLNAWNALEILVSKLFFRYEQAFLSHFLSADASQARHQYVQRIREVMRGKYRLTDKFALLASELSETTADGDIGVFSRAKSQRDKILHGQTLDDSSLDVRGVQQLTRHYVRMHLEQLQNMA